MSLKIGNFRVTSGSYSPRENAYIFDIIYEEKENHIRIAQVNFYDEIEDIEKPMDIKIIENKIGIPFFQFQKCLTLVLDEMLKIKEEKKIGKKIF